MFRMRLHAIEDLVLDLVHVAADMALSAARKTSSSSAAATTGRPRLHALGDEGYLARSSWR
jgi:hypothetical protein